MTRSQSQALDDALKLGLIDEQTAAEVRPSEGSGKTALEAISALVEQQTITAYQAEKLLDNRSNELVVDDYLIQSELGRKDDRAEELAQALCIEAGKPIRDARGEVMRLVDTFRIASEEAGRTYGEVLPMDLSPRAVDYTGMWKRVPIGACSFITPFNFPLNLVAHKVAPAIAAGCPFVLKPSSSRA